MQSRLLSPNLLLGFSFLAALMLTGCGGTSYEPLAVDKMTTEQIQTAPMLGLNEDKPGVAVDVQKYLAGGKYTLVQFYSPHSPDCIAFQASVARLPQMYNYIAVRNINIDRPDAQGIDLQSAAAQQAGLTSLPYFYIYEPNHNLRAHGRPAKEQVMQWLTAASSPQTYQ